MITNFIDLKDLNDSIVDSEEVFALLTFRTPNNINDLGDLKDLE